MPHFSSRVALIMEDACSLFRRADVVECRKTILVRLRVYVHIGGYICPFRDMNAPTHSMESLDGICVIDGYSTMFAIELLEEKEKNLVFVSSL